jgi:hypothetical protein
MYASSSGGVQEKGKTRMKLNFGEKTTLTG